ncbi:MAG: glycosidase, partial [Deltaproteobacteria bacterium]
MIRKYENNPIIKPSDVKPSIKGYKVVGAFNPGATIYGDEILLLLRVAEKCLPERGYVRTPIYKFENGRSIPA